MTINVSVHEHQRVRSI